ncbi:hypothetical protein P3X46_017102 [Hevea brasiliensis]|uniref:SUF system FeS cluster assembly SufBD core domain-containing protein n=1 Tax=Hevea brasiliensis TaxID=3981 RepID=A0ABQ9M304_HEVBR|nr:hypothetical protein P3X46_017102 [Hevea brasiliensis]
MSALVFTPQIHTSTTITSKLKHKPKHKVKTSVSLARTPIIQASFSDPFILQLPFRFIDTSFIKLSQIHPISKPPSSNLLTNISKDTHLPNIVIVDRFILNSMPNSSNSPHGVYVGSLLSDPKDKIAQTFFKSKVLVVVEEGGEVGIIEEFVSVGSIGKCYCANSVLEVMIEEEAKKSASTFELVDVSTGGKLTRHNLLVRQLGPDRSTELSTFHLSLSGQTQDLHSRLILDHPPAYSQQLHKCIVAHSLGQSVFDGNVNVNRYAQQTDAGQLTRSLLLEPCATVNVKPNLQIIADDVKCFHGAVISNLEESQLFYFQSRGIDLETARKALVFSSGSEVIEQCPYSFVRNQVEKLVTELLSSTGVGPS